MSATLTVRDETTTGDISEGITLEFLTDHITVRELIRERVYQEVKDFNARKSQVTFRGLVKPTDAEQTLNGYRLKKPRMIDWHPQFAKACEAFEANAVLVAGRIPPPKSRGAAHRRAWGEGLGGHRSS